MSKIELPNFKNLISGGIEGIGNAAANIIGKLKADPTKVAEAEKELAELQVNAKLESERIANESERIANETLKIEIEAEKNRLQDIADARLMNKEIQLSDKASWLSKNVGYIIDLFLGALWGTITVIIVLKLFNVAAQNVDMVTLVSIHGTVTAVFMVTVQFHRGSSVGSHSKEKQLSKLSK